MFIPNSDRKTSLQLTHNRKLSITSYIPYMVLLNSDKYMVAVLQLLGNWCSSYNNNCITKLWAPDINVSIYTCFSWHCFYISFQCYLHHYKLLRTLQNHWVESSTQSSRVIQNIFFRLFCILSDLFDKCSANGQVLP